MPAYAVAHMRQVTMGPAIVEYLQRIDATLEPFGGRFIVHGGEFEVLEGTWPGGQAELGRNLATLAGDSIMRHARH